MGTEVSSSQATIVTPEQAVPIKPFGLDMKILLTGEATDGTISVVIVDHKPGEGPPDHVHFSQEEMLFVIEGTYELTAGGKSARIGPGTLVFIPRNVVHRFMNVGEGTARMLDWSLPAGHDRYFRAVSEFAAGGGFTDERIKEINKLFGTNFPAAP